MHLPGCFGNRRFHCIWLILFCLFKFSSLNWFFFSSASKHTGANSWLKKTRAARWEIPVRSRFILIKFSSSWTCWKRDAIMLDNVNFSNCCFETVTMLWITQCIYKKKMWRCQNVEKVNNYRTKHGLQHWALDYTELQAISTLHSFWQHFYNGCCWFIKESLCHHLEDVFFSEKVIETSCLLRKWT